VSLPRGDNNVEEEKEEEEEEEEEGEAEPTSSSSPYSDFSSVWCIALSLSITGGANRLARSGT
jgi:hypothetical protein